ncbi:MAG: biotin synthase BioB [Parachlamydiaceae bacterium]
MKWTYEKLHMLYQLPLFELIEKAQAIHREYQNPKEIQICTLISVKTGGCPENCSYCAQSSRYQTSVKAQPLMAVEEMIVLAKKAKAKGATRICLGAAWREARHHQPFQKLLGGVRAISEMGLEVCCTLGMLNEDQALQLKEAGAYAYNHNLDTSREYYPNIVTSRTYDDRLATLKVAHEAGLKVCCGGIIGLGESISDRLKLILQMSQLTPPPESIPINLLVPIPGTPLQNQPRVSIWEMLRIIAIVRIAIPKAMIRLSAGRSEMTLEQHALCFLAGANSLFSGERLLTVTNPHFDHDDDMLSLFGLTKKVADAHN